MDGIDSQTLIALAKENKLSILLIFVIILVSLVAAYLLSFLLERYIEKHLDDSPWLEENRKKIRLGFIAGSTVLVSLSFLSTTDVFSNLAWVLAPLAIGIVYLARKAIQNIVEFFLLLLEGKIHTKQALRIINAEFFVDTSGRIKEQNTRKAFIKTYNGGEVILKHHVLFEGIIHAYGRSQYRRCTIQLHLPVSIPQRTYEQTLLQVVASYPKLLVQYPQDVLLHTIKNGQYHYQLQFWVDKSVVSLWNAKKEIKLALLQEFETRALPLPYIQIHTEIQES